ncbi:MAG: hypothetical protein ACE5HV_11320, partial [Acidobacteriota bacterium]
RDVGATISAIGLRGAELTAEDFREVELQGETLDHGGNRSVTVHVTNILPFLVLKSFALDERVKDKDAYDIVWTLAAYSGGGGAAAVAAKESPVREYHDVIDGIDRLRDHFAEIDAAGASFYARFFGHGDPTDETGIRLRRFARGSVQQFLEEWDRGVD